VRRRSTSTRSTLAAAVLAAFAALAAPSTDLGAAGLGRLTVQSSLGQPLRAEVEVTSLSAQEAQSLAARLASPEAFAQAGLQFSPALTGLQLSVEARGSRTLVRISSSQPMNEPFVDLLLELSWNGGKLLREYTFLLDPPASVASGSAAATPPAAGATQAAQTTQEVSSSRATPARAGSSQAALSATESPSRSRAPADPISATPTTSGTIEVRRGDTLSAIAGRVKPATATLDQAMIALFQANPNAFSGNINLLKSGGTLIVPDAAGMAALAPEEARNQVRMQSADFASYRRQLAGLAPAVASAPSGSSASGSVSARVTEGTSPPQGTDRLRLSRPESQGTSGAATGSAVGRAGSQASAAEQAVARDAALRESQSRLEALERTVDDLKKLLELRNRAMADLQAQLDEARAAGKSIRGTVNTLPEAAPTPAGSAAPAAGSASPSSPAVSSGPAVAGAAASATPDSASSATPASQPASVAAEPVTNASGQASENDKQAPPPVAAASAPTSEPQAAARPPATAAPTPPAPDFLDELLDNPLLLPALGGVAALGGGYALYAIRRRRRVERFEDSLIAADALAPNSLFGATGGQNVDTRQVDLPPDGPATQIQATEVDPIEEANVYVAYGREAQAEDILREGMKRHPERHAIRHRLLELYAARSDRPAFEALARELHAMTGAQGEDWDKARVLGRLVDPDNPLYAAAEVNAAEPSDAQAVPDLDFRTDASLDMASLAVNETPPKSMSEELSPDLAPLELDLELPAAGQDPVQFQETEQRNRAGSTESLLARVPDLPDSLDLDLDLEALEAISKIESPAAPAKDDHSLADLGIDLDLDSGAPERRSEVAETVSDSARWQEMATKLDLASAYEEIGDKEGARELLEEVLAGGDAQQQTRAREMLAKLA